MGGKGGGVQARGRVRFSLRTEEGGFYKEEAGAEEGTGAQRANLSFFWAEIPANFFTM